MHLVRASIFFLESRKLELFMLEKTQFAAIFGLLLNLIMATK